MNFAPFWARGSFGTFSCWRWSFNSAAEAQAAANEAARRLAERFGRDEKVPSRQRGYYPDRPFREQVLREIKNSGGEVIGLVTRNSYGCLVLNTARVMFVDVDLPEPRRSGWLKRLFGKPDLTPAANPQAEVLAKAEGWARKNPRWGWQIYRTKAGLRLLATHGLFETDASVSNGVFDTLDADPLYRQLCKTQKCFRARLTPKPWRCGVRDRPHRWPWLEPKEEARFKQWETRYQSRAANFATCELIRKPDGGSVHPDVQLVLNLHDETTRAESKMALA